MLTQAASTLPDLSLSPGQRPLQSFTSLADLTSHKHEACSRHSTSPTAHVDNGTMSSANAMSLATKRYQYTAPMSADANSLSLSAARGMPCTACREYEPLTVGLPNHPSSSMVCSVAPWRLSAVGRSGSDLLLAFNLQGHVHTTRHAPPSSTKACLKSVPSGSDDADARHGCKQDTKPNGCVWKVQAQTLQARSRCQQQLHRKEMSRGTDATSWLPNPQRLARRCRGTI